MSHTELSTVVDQFRELDLIFKSGSDLDVVEWGYARKLVHAISTQNQVLECEALKGLGDLYLHKAKMNEYKAENFHKACSMYTELLRYYTSIEEKQVVQHRIRYAEKCTKLVHDQDFVKAGSINPGNAILAVSTTLQEVKKKLMLKGHATMPLIEGYTNTLVKAIVEGNKRLEIESLKSLGDVYLEKGRVGKDETAFSKSAGLYRAALGRCEDSDGRETLRHRIKYAEKVKEQERKKHQETGRTRNKKVGNSRKEKQEVTDRTNQDQLQEGCRALQTGDLDTAERNFAAALKAVRIHGKGQHWKESEPICKLSDVYFKRGEQSKDGGDFTKAAALCNAALVRAKTEDKEDIKQTIQEITQSFVKHVLSIEQTVPTDDIEKHKSVLTECRCYVEEEIKRIEQQIDPYSLDDIDPQIREVEKKRVDANKALFDTIVHQRKTFIAGLVDECMEVMGPPPCKACGHLGDNRKAISYHQQSLQMERGIYGEDNAHPDIASSLNYLGNAWSNLGDCRKAVSYYEQALQMNRSIHGKNTEHRDIASLLHNLGKAWGGLGDYRKAVSYYEQALQMMRGICGEGNAHPDIARSLNNLGITWSDLGNYRKAVSYHEQSLQMRRSIYGEGNAHPEIALSLNNLGVACRYLCDYRKAVSYHEQSLQMEWSIYGEGIAHPDITLSLNNLGLAWRNLGDYRKAVSYHEQSLQMMRGIYGEGNAHPDIASSLGNLGNSWSDIGDYRKAVSYHEQSLQMRRIIYGEGNAHPYIASSLGNLGNAWNHLGDHRKAISYYEQALEMLRSIYGEGNAHPDIASSLGNLGSAWSNLGDHRKAVSYYEQALEMRRIIYGEDITHPDITLLSNLGKAWNHLGDYRKAVSYYEQALEMMRRIYGEGNAHPDIAGSLDNLGITYRNLCDYRKAVSYHEQALQMRRSIYDSHPDIARSLLNLYVAWSDLGDHRKAVSYYEQAIEMLSYETGDD
ncbi:PREDICTED: tetratricopeptide repeat protein 28-like [Branchiostoma belcheri]|uniref:Tetratricopeptide repeat protein 28-like n=1 Tax=Branchiostoma belcheri TaxID=7741 RepID=A0A6P4ZI45_BRABE|nr:PREDICTED: tetratricopeptide repeat protein 28-like [Branchiostoma belcheri]